MIEIRRGHRNRARQQRDDQRHAQRVKGVAEGENEGLLLHDMADFLKRASGSDQEAAEEERRLAA
jgi:hypothetical protein